MAPPKTLLINPLISLSPPFGLLCIAANLEKHGYPVKVVEMDTYGKSSFDITNILKEIKNNEYEVIGITCLSSYIEIVKILIKGLKENCSAKIIVGGHHATALPEDILEMGADIVVLGEGESILPQIIKSIHKGQSLDSIPSLIINKKIPFKTKERTTFEDVKQLPIPAYNLINMERYLSNTYFIRGKNLRCGWIFTSRGCPGKCTFCASFMIHGYKVRERDIKSVIDEIEYLKMIYDIEAFYILDDTFVINEKRVIEFCKELTKRKLNLVWACHVRADFFTDKVAEAIKKSGCIQVDFGVESGSQKVLNALKKGITVEQIKKSFSIARKHKLRTLATIMIGNPTETWEDIHKTKELLDEIKPDFVYPFFTTPFPGTELYKQALENNWIDEKNMNWSTEGQNYYPMLNINFSEEELNRIYSMMTSRYHLKSLLSALKQRKFVFDVIIRIVRHPKTGLKLLFLLMTGQSRAFIIHFKRFIISKDKH